MRPILWMLLSLAFLCRTAYTSDAYFVRFSIDGRQSASGAIVRWGDEIVFYNEGTAPAVVRFLGVSNGKPQAEIPSLTLPPGQPIFLNPTPLAEKWVPVPVPRPMMWILHLDIPDEVVVESRDEFNLPLDVPEPIPFPFPLGKVSLPVFRQLVPAGKPQVHLGTDLGGRDSRENVGIFNAGADTATATIEVRRTCDGTAVDSRTVTIPANTLIQVGGLGVESSANCPPTAAEPWARYTVVTVTQPSLTFVSNLNENIVVNPAVAGAFPIVGLAVTKNERF
jgi:hypothetical protein